jgi:hypothetical protein
MTKRQGLLTAIVALAMFVALADAAHSQLPALGRPGPLVTDRPDQTESSAAVAPGFVQLEAGWTYTQHNEGTAPLGSHAVPQLLVRAGVISGLEARFGFAGWQAVRGGGAMAATDERGVGDIELGVKYQFHAGGGAAPSLAQRTRRPVISTELCS